MQTKNLKMAYGWCTIYRIIIIIIIIIISF